MDPIVKAIGDFIFVEHAPEKADAIMVVGGSHPEAAELAADLWKRQYAPYIFIGGGVSVKTGSFPGPRSKADIYDGAYATECEFYTDVLLKNGVDKAAICGEDRSGFTRQNAEFAAQTARDRGVEIRKMLLVCKAFHARRSMMFYRSAFPGTQVRVIPFAGFGITRENWFQSEYGVKRTLGELRRCGDQFDFSDVLRWLKG